MTRGYPDAKNDTYDYDSVNRLTSATSARYANQMVRNYDAAGRLTKETMSFIAPAENADLSVNYLYDNANRVTALTYPDGSKVQHTYTLRGELQGVWDTGTSVAMRTYDNGGRLTTTLLGNNLTESSAYVPNDNLISTIQVPGVTDFAYQYDADKRKVVEQDMQLTAQSQRFNYDDQNRISSWKRGTGVAPADPSVEAATWMLSPVGDWNSVATTTPTSTSIETRTHNKVHELVNINGTALSYDAKGNLTLDNHGQIFTWDFENRLLAATNLQQGQGAHAVYEYDALGRRVKQAITPVASGTTPATTVPTYYVHVGAQEVMAITGDVTAFNDPDADPEALGATPFNSATGTGARGSLLAGPGALRFNFQPSSTDTPDGWRADLGKPFGAQGNVTFGWRSLIPGLTLPVTTIDCDLLGRPLFDSVALATQCLILPLEWSLALPNGTYPVVMVVGDATTRVHTDSFIVNGQLLKDPQPWDGKATDGYEIGQFDALAAQVQVTNGKLMISPALLAGALLPRINFIEIGALGSMLDAATVARAQAAALKATHDTAKPKAKMPPMVKRNVWGTYVDELVSNCIQKPRHASVRYFTHANNQYSIAVTTSASGAVLERYSYNAYGVRSVRNATGAILMYSTLNQDRGFTSYKLDSETGLLYARARMYSPELGRFIERDPWSSAFIEKSSTAKPQYVYKDGYNAYGAYFVPNALDPSGMTCVTRCGIFRNQNSEIGGHSWASWSGGSAGFWNSGTAGGAPGSGNGSSSGPGSSGSSGSDSSGSGSSGSSSGGLSGGNGVIQSPDPRDPGSPSTNRTEYGTCLACEVCPTSAQIGAAVSRSQASPPNYHLCTYNCRDWSSDLVSGLGLCPCD